MTSTQSQASIRSLTTTEGFVCGGIAACMAVSRIFLIYFWTYL